ncbi:MAG: recombinase family protein [Planctomycetota bacterium]
MPLPTGLDYDPRGQIVLDPDRQVQDAIQLFFATFFRLASASATVRLFHQQKLLFPRRLQGGPRRGELLWGSLGEQRAVHLLHNPHFAGAYAFGRHRYGRTPDGHSEYHLLPRDQWTVLIRDAHPGYITWEPFEQIETMLSATAQAYGQDRRHGPPREGPALLQGRALCGLCGTRLTVRYHHRSHGLLPEYFCCNRGPTPCESRCQVIPGAVVDEAIGKLVIEAVQPQALEIAIAVQDKIEKRIEEADRIRAAFVQRAQYEADLARQRYMCVDPNYRLVADSLEAEWNDKLRALRQTQHDYEQQRAAQHSALDQEARRRIADLAHDFPKLWNDPRTPVKERKRMLALLIEDVTLIKQDRITAQVRFRGGATRTLELPIPLNAWQKRATNPAIVRMIDELLDEHTDAEVAQILNERALRSGADREFTAESVGRVRYNHDLKSFKVRLAERGLVTTAELCKRLRVDRHIVAAWRRSGQLRGRASRRNGHWLYEVPDPTTIATLLRPQRSAKRPLPGHDTTTPA